MQVNKNDLLDKLKKLDLVRDKTSLLNKYILFDNEVITATNKCGVTITSYFKSDFTCQINPEKIIKYLEKVKQETIDIDYDNNTLVLKDDKTDLTLKTVEMKSPTISQGMPAVEKWKELPDDFFNGIKSAFFSAVNVLLVNYTYIGSFLFMGDKLFTTNNLKMSEYTFDEPIGTFTLGYATMSIIQKITDIDSYQVTDTKVIFKAKDNTIVSCVYANIDPPKYKKLLEIPDNNIEIDFIDCLIESLDFCEILNSDISDDSKVIYFEIKKNKMVVYTETAHGKINYKYKLNKSYDNDISFCLNPSLIKEIIKQKDFKCYFDLETKIFFKNDKYVFIAIIRMDNGLQ